MREINTLSELVETVKKLDGEGKKVFVRYSLGPDTDRKGRGSRNYQTGRVENGLSCENLNPERWFVANAHVTGNTVEKWVAMQLLSYSFMLHQGLDGTRCWILTGECVGKGSDNEPLVDNWKPVAWVSESVIKEAK